MRVVEVEVEVEAYFEIFRRAERSGAVVEVVEELAVAVEVEEEDSKLVEKGERFDRGDADDSKVEEVDGAVGKRVVVKVEGVEVEGAVKVKVDGVVEAEDSDVRGVATKVGVEVLAVAVEVEEVVVVVGEVVEVGEGVDSDEADVEEVVDCE